MISSNLGSSTAIGLPYNPYEYVAAVNLSSSLRNYKLGELVTVQRIEFASDFKGDDFTGPSVNVKIIDTFNDPSHPKRYLLLSSSAADKIGLTVMKGVMQIAVWKTIMDDVGMAQ